MTSVSNMEEARGTLAKILEIWNTLPSDTLRELVTSMPNRLQAVVEARGGHTKY